MRVVLLQTSTDIKGVGLLEYLKGSSPGHPAMVVSQRKCQESNWDVSALPIWWRSTQGFLELLVFIPPWPAEEVGFNVVQEISQQGRWTSQQEWGKQAKNEKLHFSTFFHVDCKSDGVAWIQNGSFCLKRASQKQKQKNKEVIGNPAAWVLVDSKCSLIGNQFTPRNAKGCWLSVIGRRYEVPRKSHCCPSPNFELQPPEP